MVEREGLANRLFRFFKLRGTFVRTAIKPFLQQGVRKTGMGRCKSRIQAHRLLKQWLCGKRRFISIFLQMPQTALISLPGGHFCRVAALDFFEFGQADLRRDRRRNCRRDFILDGEKILQFAVKAFRPDVPVAGGVDQLNRNPATIPGAPDAAFQKRILSSTPGQSRRLPPRGP